MLEILSIDQDSQWNDCVRSMPEYDFYHLAQYHRLDRSGYPYLIVYREDDLIILLPVIVRDIEGTEYKDITSVYGYTGPLTNKAEIDPEVVARFHDALRSYFDVQNIVSFFCRLHPFFPWQEHLINGLGEIEDSNTTVAIDLTIPEAEQRAAYSHSLKNDINRLNRLPVSIRNVSKKAEIDEFIEVYYENMDRQHAAPSYYFGHEYFYDFLKEIPSDLIIAKLNEQIISGSVYTYCNGIIQSHLSATKEEYLNLSPIKSLWNEICITGRNKQMKYFHLGGGFGGQNDTLFDFKAQFSSLRFQFKTWKYIHQANIYNLLVRKNVETEKSDSSFFPLYRRPI